jgi:hypothetical protein
MCEIMLLIFGFSNARYIVVSNAASKTLFNVKVSANLRIHASDDKNILPVRQALMVGTY